MLYINIIPNKEITKLSGVTINLINPQEAFILADFALIHGGYLEPSEWAAEAILLRVLRRVREGKVKPNQIKVTVDGTVLGVTEDGDFNQPFPGGFYNWRADELF